MKRIAVLFMLSYASYGFSAANCDLSKFKWDCDLPMKVKPSHVHQSLVYCNDLRGYISPAEFQVLSHYYRRDVNMVLRVNGEYIDAPCVPIRRYESVAY